MKEKDEVLRLKVLEQLPGRDGHALRRVQEGLSIKLPEIVKEMLSRNGLDAQGGSNCWNTTLKVLGEPVPYRWEETSDMHVWLQTKTKRIPKSHLRPGDIISFYGYTYSYGREYSLQHTLLYLGRAGEECIVFHKNASRPFEFSTLSLAHEYDMYQGSKVYYHRPQVQVVSELDPVQGELNL